MRQFVREYLEGVWRYRHLWQADLAVLLLAGAALGLLFSLTTLDLNIQRLFYREESPLARWEMAEGVPWRWFRALPALLVVGIVLSSLGILAASRYRPGWSRYRPHCLFLMVALLLGPFLIVNVALKPNWGRPRPFDVKEFEGRRQYRAPLELGAPGQGQSFPSGDASVGFFLSSLYLLWRRELARKRVFALGLSLVLGGAIGYGRMAVGAHFLWDIVGAALIVFLTNGIAYYFLVNVPAREDRLAGAPWIRS